MTTAEGVAADVQGGSRTELGHRPGPRHRPHHLRRGPHRRWGGALHGGADRAAPALPGPGRLQRLTGRRRRRVATRVPRPARVHCSARQLATQTAASWPLQTVRQRTERCGRTLRQPKQRFGALSSLPSSMTSSMTSSFRFEGSRSFDELVQRTTPWRPSGPWVSSRYDPQGGGAAWTRRAMRRGRD